MIERLDTFGTVVIENGGQIVSVVQKDVGLQMLHKINEIIEVVNRLDSEIMCVCESCTHARIEKGQYEAENQLTCIHDWDKHKCRKCGIDGNYSELCGSQYCKCVQ